MTERRNHTDSNSIRLKWIEQAEKAFADLFQSDKLTLFDQMLFGNQYPKVLFDKKVSFPDIDDKDIKRIRSNRLKMLGYKWDGTDKSWSKEEQSTETP